MCRWKKCAKSAPQPPALKMFTFAQIIGFDRNLVQSTPIAIIYRQTVQGSLLTDPCLCTDVVKDEKGDSKRQRTSYTRFQTLELEKEFHFNRLIGIELRFKISNKKTSSDI